MLRLEDKLVMDVVRDGVRKHVYDTNRPAILKGDLVELFVDDN